MFPPAIISTPLKKSRRRSPVFVVVPLFSALVGAIALLLAMSKAYLPSPTDAFPLHKTVEAPTERELLLLDANGRPFARRGGCYDRPVSIGEIPPHFIDALISTEDRRFNVHFGIDPVGIIRAAITNYNAGKIVQGGSTITQQLAKISYLSPTKSMDRKLREAIAVLRLEASLSKDEIIERYLSRAYFGEGCFGLRAAARYYFKKPVSRLSVAQSAMLVALLKSPAQLSRDREALMSREQVVLNSMVETGKLDVSVRMGLAPAKPRIRQTNAFGAYYADWIADIVKGSGGDTSEVLKIRTGFDRGLQAIAEKSLGNTMRRYGRYRKASQAALVAMRPDGRVVAMVGGLDYNKSQFNRASQALRQPGSSFKAFVYLAALRGGAHPDMLVADSPITIGDWTPQNYDNSFRGIMPLRRAFSSSINTVAVKLTDAMTPKNVSLAARDMGITSRISEEDPSIALGTAEVTLLELTSAYAAFSANAYPVKPWGILATGNRSHGRVRPRPPEGAGRWNLTEGPQMREFLQATVQYGTGRAARLSIPSFGKTGTSQSYRDAWFIGFAGNLVVGVWVGNDDNSPMARVTGGSLPAMIWRDFMGHAALKDRNFRPQLPQRIAYFRAEKPRNANRKPMSLALQTLLMNQPTQYASGFWGGADFRQPMLIGQPQPGMFGYGAGQGPAVPPGYYAPQPGYGSAPGYTRRRGSWNPFGDR